MRRFPISSTTSNSITANDLPTYKGDGGGYWEDGIGSDAYFEAEDRTNQNRALSAEMLSSFTHSITPELNPPPACSTISGAISFCFPSTPGLPIIPSRSRTMKNR